MEKKQNNNDEVKRENRRFGKLVKCAPMMVLVADTAIGASVIFVIFSNVHGGRHLRHVATEMLKTSIFGVVAVLAIIVGFGKWHDYRIGKITSSQEKDTGE